MENSEQSQIDTTKQSNNSNELNESKELNKSNDLEHSSVPVVRYPESNDLRLVTFTFLPGYDLFHKIAVTSKSIREKLLSPGWRD